MVFNVLEIFFVRETWMALEFSFLSSITIQHSETSILRYHLKLALFNITNIYSSAS